MTRLGVVVVAVVVLGSSACGTVEADAIDAREAIDATTPVADADPIRADAAPTVDAKIPDAMSPPDGAVCGVGSTCVAEAPASWNGPVAVYEGEPLAPPPTCPAAYPTQDHTLNTGLIGGGTCGCDCETATGFSCSSTRVTQHGSNPGGGSCVSFNPPEYNATSTCVSRFIPANLAWQQPSNPAPTGGSCAPKLLDSLTTPTWSRRTRACSNTTLGAGGCNTNQICAPNADASFTKICVWAAGDNACPAGSPYSQRSVHYSDFSDGRSCDACTCGGVEGSCDGAVVFQSDCSTLPALLASVAPGVCAKLTERSYGIRYSPNPTVSCTPSAGNTSGVATPNDAGAVTVCCLP